MLVPVRPSSEPKARWFRVCSGVGVVVASEALDVDEFTLRHEHIVLMKSAFAIHSNELFATRYRFKYGIVWWPELPKP